MPICIDSTNPDIAKYTRSTPAACRSIANIERLTTAGVGLAAELVAEGHIYSFITNATAKYSISKKTRQISCNA